MQAAGLKRAASLAQLLQHRRGSLLNRVLSEGKCGITARLQQHPELLPASALTAAGHSWENQTIPAPLRANIPCAVAHIRPGHPELLLPGTAADVECAQKGLCAFSSACPLQALLQEQPGMSSRDRLQLPQGAPREAAAPRDLWGDPFRIPRDLWGEPFAIPRDLWGDPFAIPRVL